MNKILDGVHISKKNLTAGALPARKNYHKMIRLYWLKSPDCVRIIHDVQIHFDVNVNNKSDRVRSMLALSRSRLRRRTRFRAGRSRTYSLRRRQPLRMLQDHNALRRQDAASFIYRKIQRQ